MQTRRTYTGLFWIGLILTFQSLSPSPVKAQSIAVIKSRNLPSFDQVLASLKTAYPESKIETYSLKGKKKAQKDILKKITAHPPQLILAMGPLAAQVAKESLPDIPMLYCMVSNPHRYGLLGKNIVGIPLDVPGETQFSIFKSVVPNLQTIGVIYDPQESSVLIQEAIEAARKLGLDLIDVPVSSHKKVPGALRGMLGKIDALWMVPDDTVLTTDSFRFFLVTSFENKLPFLAISEIFVKVGALATLSPDHEELGHQICALVTQIQNGQLDLSETDVVPLTETNLVINAKTAKKIGLALPPEIVESASKVYR